MLKKEKMLAIIIKVVAIIVSVYGMMKSFEDMMFFTYFTNISNLFIDVMLLISLYYDISFIRGKQYKMPQSLYIIKYMATLSITLTFFVYMLILAPTHEAGFMNAYLDNHAGSLCVHLINPLLSIIDFLVFDVDYECQNKHVLFATIPPLTYMAFVIVLGQCFSVRWKDGMIAPYNFFNYGAKTGWFGFDLSQMGSTTLGIGCFYMVVVLLLIFIALGKIFLKCKRKAH